MEPHDWEFPVVRFLFRLVAGIALQQGRSDKQGGEAGTEILPERALHRSIEQSSMMTVIVTVLRRAHFF